MDYHGGVISRTGAPLGLIYLLGKNTNGMIVISLILEAHLEGCSPTRNFCVIRDITADSLKAICAQRLYQTSKIK